MRSNTFDLNINRAKTLLGVMTLFYSEELSCASSSETQKCCSQNYVPKAVYLYILRFKYTICNSNGMLFPNSYLA